MSLVLVEDDGLAVLDPGLRRLDGLKVLLRSFKRARSMRIELRAAYGRSMVSPVFAVGPDRCLPVSMATISPPPSMRLITTTAPTWKTTMITRVSAATACRRVIHESPRGCVA
ncbi:hypothetical protein [Thauera propionica]|jgi:hypothetical protein|uniref:hypothetical protein n=1 Tax=Thauera propionica TaxID=2019431 RepID=UPI0023F47111|nr:hypothetical protein [Thauera propionica]MDD3677176.1 hypothetical protein [Thauera propionica]